MSPIATLPRLSPTPTPDSPTPQPTALPLSTSPPIARPTPPAAYFNLLQEHYQLSSDKRAATDPFENLKARPSAHRSLSEDTLDRLFPKVAYGVFAETRRRASEAVVGGGPNAKQQQSNIPRPTCPVCLATFEANDEIRVIKPCQHFFHASEDCIDAWILKSTVTAVLSEGMKIDDRDVLSFERGSADPSLKFVCGSCPTCRRNITPSCADPEVAIPSDLPTRYDLVAFLSASMIDINPLMFTVINNASNPASDFLHGDGDHRWSFDLAPGFDPVAAAAITMEQQRLQEEEEQRKWYNKTKFTRVVKKMLDPQREWVDERGQRWMKGYRGLGLTQFVKKD